MKMNLHLNTDRLTAAENYNLFKRAVFQQMLLRYPGVALYSRQ